MSEEPRESTGRVTTAMVFRAVDDLGKITAANFETVNVRLDTLASLPTAVAALHERVLLTEERLTHVERSDALQETEEQRRRGYRRVQLPAFALGTLSLIVAIVVPVFVG